MFKAHRHLYHSTLGVRVIKKKNEEVDLRSWLRMVVNFALQLLRAKEC